MTDPGESHSEVTLRSARDDDSASLRAWRNDPDAVRYSVSRRAVTIAEHERWFRRVQDDSDRFRVWIAEQHGERVGQVRIDITGEAGTVSIAVAPTHRGHGVGTAMLRALTESVHAEGAPRVLIALVRSDNAASLRAFEAATFHRVAGEGDLVHLEWP